MLNVRKLYGEITIGGKELDFDKRNSSIHLKYYKTTNEQSSRNTKKYGIEIIKEEINGTSMKKEKSTAYEISDNEQIIDKLLKLFLKNKVTPITTNDILTDLHKAPELIYNIKY